MKYGAFVVLLAMNIMSLHRGSTTVIDEMEYSVRIWTDALAISAIIGEIGSLMVLDQFNIMLTGKTLNFVDDIQQESSENVSVKYNGIIVGSLFFIGIMALYILNMYLQNKLLLITLNCFSIVFAILTVIYIMATYLKTKNVEPKSIFSKLSNPVFIPVIICMIQILVTRTNLVGLVFNNIYNPQNDIYLVLTIIIVLCYFIAVTFCHFSNIYCLIAFVFIKKDVGKIEKKFEYLREKEKNLEESLRGATQLVDDKVEQSGFIKSLGSVFFFLFTHIKMYIQGRIYAISYLLAFINLKTTKRLSTLLEPERIKINGIRFCCIMAVLELLSLNLLLSIYLEDDEPCLKFFELLSTVIIIPVLLSWVTELKSKKNNGL